MFNTFRSLAAITAILAVLCFGHHVQAQDHQPATGVTINGAGPFPSGTSVSISQPHTCEPFISFRLTAFSGQPLGMLLVAVLILLTCIWGFRDARRRGKSGLGLIMLTIFTWPISIIWWLWLRPTLPPASAGQTNAPTAGSSATSG